MNQVIDPVTGMAVPANPAQQTIQQPVQQPMQPVNVGMPGSTVIPPEVGHNMQQAIQAGGRMLAPIRQNGNPLQDPNPNYPKGKNIGQGYQPKSKSLIEKAGDAYTKHVVNPTIETVEKGIDMYTDNVYKPIKKGVDMYTDKVVKPAMELPSKAIDAVFPQKFSKPK